MSDTSPLEFPCEFPIKVMGPDEDGFVERARSLIEQHTGALDDNRIRQRHSRGGRFIAVTFTIQADSRAQLDAVYLALSRADDIMLVL